MPRQFDIEQLKGSWALVTGASAGIGEEFCIQLARAGINVVMVARRKNVLDALARRLETDFNVQCISLALSLDDVKTVDQIKKDLDARNVKIRLLVNNAGLNFYGRFEEMDTQLIGQMININMISVAGLCKIFLDDLKAQSPSAIINVSSQAAFNPVPGSALYAATKAFVHSLSLSLYEELKTSGVAVQTLIPGPTQTETTKKSNPLFKSIKQWSTTADVVQASLTSLKTGNPVVTTAKDIFIQKLFVSLLPEKIILKKVGSMFLKPIISNDMEKI